MAGMCEDRVCIVTGAGRGLGREYALTLAAQGAKVVVNDLGGSRDGTGASSGPADDVVAEIRAAGGDAISSAHDVSSLPSAREMIELAVGRYGRLDALVNNAGILRDRMLVNMTESDWDDVIRVHLKGTWAPSRIAAEYWRGQSKEGKPVNARLINTTSVSGIYGNVGQSNYGAAKAGIAAFTYITSMELRRYGVTVNAIAPSALTRLTADLPHWQDEDAAAAEAARGPRWVAPLCAWLVSTQSDGITGRVLEANPKVVAVAEGWHRGPTAGPIDDPLKFNDVIRDLLIKARPNADMAGQDKVDE